MAPVPGRLSVLVTPAPSSALCPVLDSGMGSPPSTGPPCGPPLPKPALPTLLSVFGASDLKAWAATLGCATDLGLPSDSTSLLFKQVLYMISTLQRHLQESEAMVAELQVKADGLEEERRMTARTAEWAKRARDEAVRRCVEAEVAAIRTRSEANTVVEHYMEAQVLRSQLEAANEELQQLREESTTCQSELQQGVSRLADAADADERCEAAISELCSAHREEVAMLKCAHADELAELRVQHTAGLAELDSSCSEEASSLESSHSEELGRLRAVLDSSRWQTEVYAREQQDVVQEVCFRQRENARLAKKHAEARHEATELSVRLEMLRAMEAGMPAQEAEVLAVRHRYALLQRTKLEWQEALERKRADCEAWRRRAVQRGAATPGERDELEEYAFCDMDIVRPTSPASAEVPTTMCGADNSPVMSMGAAEPPAPTSGARTPQAMLLRTLQPRRHSLGAGNRQLPAVAQHTSPAQQPVPPQLRRRHSTGDTMRAAPRPGAPSNVVPAPPLPLKDEVARYGHGDRPWSEQARAVPRQPVLELPALEDSGDEGTTAPDSAPPGPAAEFLGAALRLAMLQADGEMSRDQGGSMLSAAIVEAENEVGMLAFLLDDGCVGEAGELLKQETQRQLPAIAQRLHAQLVELSTKGKQRQQQPPPPQLRSYAPWHRQSSFIDPRS